MELSHTKESGLSMVRITGFSTLRRCNVAFWQHKQEGRMVGPQYPSKAEALVDTGRYAVDGGWMGSYNQTKSPA